MFAGPLLVSRRQADASWAGGRAALGGVTAARACSLGAMPRKPRPPKLQLSFGQLGLEKKPSFTLSEDGSFLSEDGLEISARGIVQTPSSRSSLSSTPGSRSFVKPGLAVSSLDELEPLHELGSGASGQVRLARHRPSGRLIALKIINVVAEREKRKQIMNELRVLCTLQHPQLVPLYDAFYTEGYVYMALRYMDGGSLERLLASYQALAGSAGIGALGLPEHVLRSVVTQVTCGLQHLHARRLVHRDLKPANILIDSTGAAAVADFGMSKELEETRGMARSFVGTAAYMAPERIQGADHSAPSDVWSLGIICVECAQGYHPYRHVLSYYDLVVEITDSAATPRLPPASFSSALCAFSAACATPAVAQRATCDELLAHGYLGGGSGGGGGVGQPMHSSFLAAAAGVQLGQWIATTFGVQRPPPAAATGEDAAAMATMAAAAAAAAGATTPPAMATGAAGSGSPDGSPAVGPTDDDQMDESSDGVRRADAGTEHGDAAASAARIQAHWYGSQTRRELEELRLLEAEALRLGGMTLDEEG